MLLGKRRTPDYSELPEEDVISMASGGDSAAFAFLLEKYQAMIYRLLLRSTRREADAADLCQDTFFSAWQHLSSFRGDCLFSTWLCRIAENKCRDRGRLLARLKETSLTREEDGEESEWELPDPSDAASPERCAEQRETAALVREAIDQLPGEQRQLILLRDIQGLSYREIARLLDLELGTVKSRLSRGREALKISLTGRNIL